VAGIVNSFLDEEGGAGVALGSRRRGVPSISPHVTIEVFLGEREEKGK